MRRIIAAFVMSAALLAVPLSAQAQTNHSRPNPAQTALAKVLPEAKFTNIPLSDAIDFLRDVSGANINVDWKSLEQLNISKDTQINLDLHQVRLSKILSLVLNEAAPGDLLTYYIDENVIEITSRVTADQKLITIVYYVDDILDQDTPFDHTINVGGGSFTNGNASTVGTGTTSVTNGSGAGNGLFATGGPSTGASRAATAASDKKDRAQALIKMIENIIRPEIWKDNGSGTAVIEYFNGNLIVTAPRSVQEAIGGPLD